MTMVDLEKRERERGVLDNENTCDEEHCFLFRG